jgi:hypothetical protein
MAALSSCQTKSWANIVSGSIADENVSVQPATKGSLQAKCRGELLTMLGTYGWIKALQPIDHPEAGRHGGRIYIHKKDFRSRSEPQAGDEVTFCVYADDDGVGAEDCYIVGEAMPAPEQHDTCQWVNTRPHEADDDMGSDEEDDDDEGFFMSARANEFVPSCWSSTMNPTAVEFQPQVQNVGVAFNMSYFSDDSDSDSESDFEPTMIRSKHLRSHGDRSTQASDTSDSDLELCASKVAMMMPPGLTLPPGLEPPPGLEFPSTTELEPPPGLELTPEEMLLNRLQVVA